MCRHIGSTTHVGVLPFPGGCLTPSQPFHRNPLGLLLLPLAFSREKESHVELPALFRIPLSFRGGGWEPRCHTCRRNPCLCWRVLHSPRAISTLSKEGPHGARGQPCGSQQFAGTEEPRGHARVQGSGGGRCERALRVRGAGVGGGGRAASARPGPQVHGVGRRPRPRGPGPLSAGSELGGGARREAAGAPCCFRITQRATALQTLLVHFPQAPARRAPGPARSRREQRAHCPLALLLAPSRPHVPVMKGTDHCSSPWTEGVKGREPFLVPLTVWMRNLLEGARSSGPSVPDH